MMKLSSLPAVMVLAVLVTVALATPLGTHDPGDFTFSMPDLQIPSTSIAPGVETENMEAKDLTPTVTAPHVQPRADYTVPFLPTYQVLMGNDIQHVGQVKGETLKAELTTALQYLCPEIPSGQLDRNHGTTCKINEQYVIGGVEYNDDGWLAKKAWLNVWVSSAYLPWNARDDFIETAALVYFRQTEDSKNCQTVYLHTNEGGEKQSYYWCNVGREVEINTISGYGAHLKVNVAFNGKTINAGQFDCKAIEQSVWDHMRTDKSQGTIYYQYTQWYADRNLYPPYITAEIWCPDERVTGTSANISDVDTAPDVESKTILYDEDWQPSAWEELGNGGEWFSRTSA